MMSVEPEVAADKLQKILRHAVSLDEEMITSFRQAIELGRFPEGRRLVSEELALCIQVVIAWEAVHLPEQQRTAYIDRGTKMEGERCETEAQSVLLR